MVSILILVSTLLVVRDVERVVGGRAVGIVAALDHERVRLAPDHVNLRDQETIDVPGNAPANMTSNTGIALIAARGSDLSKEHPVVRLVAL